MTLAEVLLMVGIGIVVTHRMRPQCPKCKSKMHETFPHNNQEVYRCDACEREWIQL